MKITQDLRELAAAEGVSPEEAAEVGLEQKSAEFRAAGGKIYLPRAEKPEDASAVV
jgi:phosphomethylpyrimidine synthase